MIADVQHIWMYIPLWRLKAIVSPAFLVIAQMSPTYTYYFPDKDYFLSQAYFSYNGVIILRH